MSDAPDAGDAVLITRYLDFSLPYWYLLGRGDPSLADRLMDAGVALLVRLHLEGVFRGDCSLSNILWRRDAVAMPAYLVDAETTERHETISDRMRRYDLETAVENIAGGLLDCRRVAGSPTTSTSSTSTSGGASSSASGGSTSSASTWRSCRSTATVGR